MHTLVLGILDADSAETAINNLTEADVPEDTISLVMQDTTKARAIIDDTGPLRGITTATLAKALQQKGVAKQLVEKYEQLVEQGKALVAVSGNQEVLDLVEAVFHDYQHQAVLEL